MAQKRTAEEASPSPDKSQPSRKRSLEDIEVDGVEATPSKRRRSSASRNGAEPDDSQPGIEDVEMAGVGEGAAVVDQEPAPEPPKSTPRKRGRPRKNPINGDTPTPNANRQAVLKTPTKGDVSDDATPRKQAAGADRSARRKSARALIEHVVGDEGSEDEQEVDGLAREIYESGESEDGDDQTDGATTVDDEGADKTDTAPDTPSKTPKRGRKKRAKSPTPPRDLPTHELYFAQNKPGRPKTSNNTLASLDLLTHEEYFNILREQEDRHKDDIEYLESLHAESFPQWTFELAQGFSICLYGFGSKRSLLQKFAKHLHYNGCPGNKTQKIVIVNGYSQTTTMRDVLTTVGLALDQRIPSAPPSTMAQAILSHLSSLSNQILTIMVNSMDATPLRKSTHQSTLAQLAAHPQIRLVCSTDTPDFPLLWDIGQRSAFSFASHDATTFAPFTVELDVVDDVHELLGRKARRVNGREGVAFVLRSLPENARNLFQLLVGEVLIAMEEDAGVSEAEDVGVEYRMVYNKAVEEFICSSEMAFRTLLKEFHDHQIITSRKDALGTEQLSVPFRREELEAILEDLMG